MEALAAELGIPFVEVSAKDNHNVDKAFLTLVKAAKNRLCPSKTTKEDVSSCVGVYYCAVALERERR